MIFRTCLLSPPLHFAEEREFIADRLAGIAPKRYIPGTVKLGESSGRAGGFPVRLNVAWDIIAGRGSGRSAGGSAAATEFSAG
jgi:hypothetical protein